MCTFLMDTLEVQQSFMKVGLDNVCSLSCQFYYTQDQGRSQNFKQVYPSFMKVFNIDDVTLTSQIKKSYRKINIANEKIINYRVTFPSIHCCQICILAGERPGISFIICCFLFLRQEHVHVNKNISFYIKICV